MKPNMQNVIFLVLFKSHNIFTNMFTLFMIFYFILLLFSSHTIRFISLNTTLFNSFHNYSNYFRFVLVDWKTEKKIKWFLLLFFSFCICISVEIVTFQWYLLTRESYKESRKNRLRKSIVVLKSFFLLMWYD